MMHQRRLLRPCISRLGCRNGSLSPYLSHQQILCRLRSSTSTSLIKDDSNNEEETNNTSYVVKKVKSAPISSLFTGNSNNYNNRNEKQATSTTFTPRRRRGRSRSDTKSEQQLYNTGLNGSNNSNSKKKISGSSLQHYFTRPSRIGNPTVYTTEPMNTKIEEEESSNSNSSILKQYIIEPVIRALQQFTSAIGFTNTNNNNTIINSLLLPSTSRQRYHDINRSKRRYQCNECGYQVKRWTSLLSRMQHCAHCTTSVDTSSELAPKDFAIYLDDDDTTTTTTSITKNNNNMSFEWRRINSYQNNLRQQQKKRKMTKEMKLERFRSNNGYVIPQMYRTPIKEEETVKEVASVSPKASSSSRQPKEIVERKHNTSKIVKRRKKKLYQCEECGQTTKLWKHFRAMKRDCTLCDTRAGLKRTDFLRILNNVR